MSRKQAGGAIDLILLRQVHCLLAHGTASNKILLLWRVNMSAVSDAALGGGAVRALCPPFIRSFLRSSGTDVRLCRDKWNPGLNVSSSFLSPLPQYSPAVGPPPPSCSTPTCLIFRSSCMSTFFCSDLFAEQKVCFVLPPTVPRR